MILMTRREKREESGGGAERYANQSMTYSINLGKDSSLFTIYISIREFWAGDNLAKKTSGFSYIRL